MMWTCFSVILTTKSLIFYWILLWTTWKDRQVWQSIISFFYGVNIYALYNYRRWSLMFRSSLQVVKKNDAGKLLSVSTAYELLQLYEASTFSQEWCFWQSWQGFLCTEAWQLWISSDRIGWSTYWPDTKSGPNSFPSRPVPFCFSQLDWLKGMSTQSFVIELFY